jgi:hypothetical protein
MKDIIRLGNKLIAGMIILVTVTVIFLPFVGLHTHIQEYFVHFLFFLLISGLMGLIIGSKTVLFTSFGCAAVLALFLKNASNLDLKNPQPNQTAKLSMAHINLSITTDVENIAKLAQDTTLDIISFQEYTPDWAAILPSVLKSSFEYHFEDLRMDVYGKVVYSRKPLVIQKKIEKEYFSTLEVAVLLNTDTLNILSIYITPALDSESRKKAKIEIEGLKNYVINHKNIALVSGEFNQVYWDHDIISFRDKTKMLNSRREVDITTMKMPYDHIFYHQKLQCVLFKEIMDASQTKVGCYATYQLKNKDKKSKG